VVFRGVIVHCVSILRNYCSHCTLFAAGLHVRNGEAQLAVATLSAIARRISVGWRRGLSFDHSNCNRRNGPYTWALTSAANTFPQG